MDQYLWISLYFLFLAGASKSPFYLVKYQLVTLLFQLTFLNTFFFSKVTSVGINTEWGLLMASISEDTGEETPLQVSYFIFIFF